MKKFLSLLVIIALCLGCTAMITACDKEKEEEENVEKEIAGTYEMTDISGSIVYNGETTTLSKDLYDYYRIIFNEDGTAKVESKGAGTTAKVEQDGTWKWTGEKLELRSENSGVTVVEEMEWNDGVITYTANQSAQGMTVTMTITLEKQS